MKPTKETPSPNEDSENSEADTPATKQKNLLMPKIGGVIQPIWVIFVLSFAAIVVGERLVRWILTHFDSLPTNIDLPTLISLVSAGFVSVRWLVQKIRALLDEIESLIERISELETELSKLQRDKNETEKEQLSKLETMQAKLNEQANTINYLELRIDHNESRYRLLQERID